MRHSLVRTGLAPGRVVGFRWRPLPGWPAPSGAVKVLDPCCWHSPAGSQSMKWPLALRLL